MSGECPRSHLLPGSSGGLSDWSSSIPSTAGNGIGKRPAGAVLQWVGRYRQASTLGRKGSPGICRGPNLEAVPPLGISCILCTHSPIWFTEDTLISSESCEKSSTPAENMALLTVDEKVVLPVSWNHLNPTNHTIAQPGSNQGVSS